MIGYHGRTQPKIVGGGQSEVQKGTLLLMMIWHQKKGTCSQKGHFFPRLPGGGAHLPPCPPLGTALDIDLSKSMNIRLVGVSYHMGFL